ncbi:MAG: branched-chain amino acid ABC transporter permease [Betaproteobacteria bacterium]|nr:MAG: branched-chain amino acid ABC transporter permease [Betaproteobacteria bacterium]
MPDSKPHPIILGAVLAGLLIIPLVVRDEYYLHLFIVSAIFVVVALGLNLIVGYVGQLSLAHAAFFALGAYVSALLFFNLKWSMWIGMPAAAIVTAAVAFALGWVILRVRGHRFVIITVAFAEIMRLVATNWVDLTRGFMGLPGLQIPALYVPGIGAVDVSSKERFYYVVLAAALLSFYICYRLVRSSVGRAFVLVRENEVLAESLGISAFRTCMIAFVVGAALAGTAGALYGHYIGFVSPDLFNFSYITIMLIMVILGGKGTLIGPALGAVVFTFLPELLREASYYRMVIFASILVIATLFMPRGIIFPLVEHLVPRRWRKGHDRAA